MSLPLSPPSAEARPYCIDHGDRKGMSLDSNGLLVRDYSVASRVRMRLLTKRGHWALHPDMGSRLHELTTRELRSKAQAVVTEALQPLIDEGEIVGITIGAIDIDEVTGYGAVEVTFTVPGIDKGISIGVPYGV